jgi:hypothetical protein
MGHFRTHAPLSAAGLDTVMRLISRFSCISIVLSLFGRACSREICLLAFEFPDRAFAECRVAVQIVGMETADRHGGAVPEAKVRGSRTRS